MVYVCSCLRTVTDGFSASSCSPVVVPKSTELPRDVLLLLIIGHPAGSASGCPYSPEVLSSLPRFTKRILGSPLHSDHAYCPLSPPEKSRVAAPKPTHRLSDVRVIIAL